MRWRRWGIATLAATVGVIAAGAGCVTWLLGHPEHLGPLISKLAGWPEGSVVLADLELGDRVHLTGFELHPPAPRAPDLYVAEGEVDWPDPWRLMKKER